MHYSVLGLLFSVVVIVSSVVSLPVDDVAQKNVNKEIKRRDTTQSAMDDMFSDEEKHKRSREGIMFGNQQNKPSGMVDDALIGLAEKKDHKSDFHIADDDRSSNNNNNQSAEMTGENENGNSDVVESDEDDVDSSSKDMAQQDEDQENTFDGFEGGFDSHQSLDMPRDWNDISAQYLDRNMYRRRRRNVVRNEHNFRKRSLRAPLEELMKFRNNGRMKRDLPYDADDVAGLLSLLAAAQLAKQRKQAMMHHGNYPFLQDSVAEVGERPLLVYDDLGGTYSYVPIGDEDSNVMYRDLGKFDDEQVNEIDEDEQLVPYHVGLQLPETGSRLQRRAYYPASIDFRAMGVPGEKRSRLDDGGGVWGRLEERRRRLLSTDQDDGQDDEDDNDDDDNDDSAADDDDAAAGEKLYTLGELLDGGGTKKPVASSVYRRLL